MTKYLGVQIDCPLDWKEQIKAVSTKFSRIVSYQNLPSPFLYTDIAYSFIHYYYFYANTSSVINLVQCFYD